MREGFSREKEGQLPRVRLSMVLLTNVSLALILSSKASSTSENAIGTLLTQGLALSQMKQVVFSRVRRIQQQPVYRQKKRTMTDSPSEKYRSSCS